MKKIIKLILVFIFLNYNICYAENKCEKNVYYLLQGKKSPCTGFLFSPEYEYKIRLKVDTFNSLENYVKKQEEINFLINERLVNAQKHNIYLSKRLEEEKNNDFWHKTLYFALGAVLTGVIAANVNQR